MGRAWHGRAVSRGRVASGGAGSCKHTVLRVGRIAPLARERSHEMQIRIFDIECVGHRHLIRLFSRLLFCIGHRPLIQFYFNVLCRTQTLYSVIFAVFWVGGRHLIRCSSRFSVSDTDDLTSYFRDFLCRTQAPYSVIWVVFCFEHRHLYSVLFAIFCVGHRKII